MSLQVWEARLPDSPIAVFVERADYTNLHLQVKSMYANMSLIVLIEGVSCHSVAEMMSEEVVGSERTTKRVFLAALGTAVRADCSRASTVLLDSLAAVPISSPINQFIKLSP